MKEPISFSKRHSCAPITRHEPVVETRSKMPAIEKIFFDLPKTTFLSPQEVATFLSVPLSIVYRLYQEGTVEGIALNHSLRIRKDSLLQYIKGGMGK